MKIHLHIGLEGCGTIRLQDVMAEKRAQLESKGVLFPKVPGPQNHTRLFMAVTAPENVDPLRFNRGFITADKQKALRDQLTEQLAQDVARAKPDILILSAAQLASGLVARSEMETLRDMLTPLSSDITVTAHIDEPARLLTRAYAAQVMEGRGIGLNAELELADQPNWWKACLDATPATEAENGIFLRNQAPAFWLDYQELAARWELVFGPGSFRFRSYDPQVWAQPDITTELQQAFDISDQIGRAEPGVIEAEPSAEWVARARQMNLLLVRLLTRSNLVLPRPMWKKFMDELQIDGPPINPASLGKISRRFAPMMNQLIAEHPALDPEALAPVHPGPEWREPAPRNGYRASQYLLAWMWRIERTTAEHAKAKLADVAQLKGDTPKPPAKDQISDAARKIMSPQAVEKFNFLIGSSFRPHNRIGQLNEEAPQPAFAPATPRQLPRGSTGRVIVGCMKNEAPYIVEWVAYHRAIGFDNFLIYTNDCTDGTDEILQRLDQLGIVQHRNNDGWKGRSPQTHALDIAPQEPVLQQADWIAHIDVDEFVNVRCGNGTLDDFFARVPQATNVAMTWRLFGHGGVTDLADRPVIEQFTACAPKFCPKPHTVWGFKTLFKNIGAYSKLSCHRPNKLADVMAGQVQWVNGSGAIATKELIKNGWRNSKKSIGYDLIQLNHYALRSADSYLIKRQRGRALHVDRSIGLNYWIRMDWCDYRDITIHRNLPRLRAEMDRLLADSELKRLHDAGFAWHQAKAAELHKTPEFQDLYNQALSVRLNETERVAYALAQDLES
ncbi:glycosyltransferase family 2 protein [Pseudooceanicola sp. MF1-13]|uniref:glycosyltransferase family 2 protein n=1 Tax=Pseudooceanicola sp. MF1-13 TaxID=3379095 RepID=UPI003891667B